MFIYETLLVTGALGILVMTLMGFAHVGGAHPAGHTGGAHAGHPPAQGLEGTLLQSAEAVTAFDANGEGLVRVLVDGQSIDVLARLTEEERREGARVVRGQTVRIEDVDTRSNRCKVSRL